MRNPVQLAQTVQRNCDIADARHAREATLCTYLLEMREFYRWESGLPLATQPRRDELGAWLAAREARWATLEAEDFAGIVVGGERFDPFHADAINQKLLGQGLVYGGGLGRFGRPHFFLARLQRTERREGLEVLVADCEYARDLSAPPASLQNGTIYLRKESLKRWLWEKIELWDARKSEGALGSALAACEFERDPARALERMAEAEAESLILHEIGEARAGSLLGAPWRELIAALTSRRAELLARAVRDNLADCASTLPALIERDATGSIHFYFANFDGMRRALFPLLANAYSRWREEGSLEPIADAASRGRAHWEAAARRLLDISATTPAGAASLDARILAGEAGLAL